MSPFDFNDLNNLPEDSAASTASNHHGTDHQPSPGEAEDHIPPNATVYNTTGPNAYTKAIEASDGSGNPAVNPRSCVTCRRRKVKCDKQMPCTTCRRALIPCIFPAPGRKPRQPRPRDPNAPQKNFSKREAELVKRLKKLEGIVEELSGQIDVDASKSTSPDVSQSMSGGPFAAPRRTASNNIARTASGHDIATSPHAPSVSSREGDSTSDTTEAAKRRDARQQFGRLVLNDHKGRTRYVSSAFWSRMNDELDSIRKDASQLTDSASDDSDYENTPETTPGYSSTTHDHHAFLLGYRSADVDLRKLYPVPSHLWFLWKIYQDSVEPLVKVLHVPSADALLRNASRDLDSLSAGDQALVFAIFFAAVVAADPEDAHKSFGSTKTDLVAQYRFAAEQALAKADFLTTTDFAVIQALTLFLIVARRYDTSRFCWSMTGLCIRLAQGLGLHRDGSFFDLTPFETEMRRRVWWAIVKLDVRSSEELGTEMTIHENGFDTELPTNLNDSDMSPGGVELLGPRRGPTDMSVHLLRCEMTMIGRRVVRAASASGQVYSVEGCEELERSLKNSYHARMQALIYEHSSGESTRDEIYFMGQIISRIVMAKMCLTIYQPILFTEPEKLASDVRQRIYVSAVELLESDTRLHCDPRTKPFRWLFLTYQIWQPIAYVLVETARRTWTPLTERAWEAVCSLQRLPLEKVKRADQAAVFLPLRKLFLYVRKHRVVELARLKKDPTEAKRLEKEEQDNETEPWFGSATDSTDRKTAIREKWWGLVQPEQPTSLPPNVVQPNSLFAAAQPGSANQVQQNMRTGADTVEMSEAQMQYLNQFMSQNGPNLADIYGLENRGMMGSGTPMMAGDLDMQSMSFSGAGSTPNSNATSSTANNQAMFGNSLAQTPQQILQPNDPLPPFMWGNWLDDAAMGPNAGVGSVGGAVGGVADDKVMDEAMMAEDLNMLDQGFDWQDWSQTMKGIEMWQGEAAPGAR